MSLPYEQLRPCKACGAPCDGDVCDAVCSMEATRQAEANNDEHRFIPEGRTYPRNLYCRICGASETEHRL